MTFTNMPRPVFHCQCGNHAWTSLTRGYVTLVSPEDAYLLEQRAWCTWDSHGTPTYAGAGTNLLHGRIRLHKAIVGKQKIDHKNRNGFDNRRGNLRPATNSQNVANGRSKKNKTGYRGVFINSKRFGAYIRVNKKSHFLGNHASPEEAARAYDAAAIKFFGAFASLNFPSSQPAACCGAFDQAPASPSVDV